MRARRVRGQHGRVTEVDDAELCKRIDLRLELAARRTAGRANGAWAESGAGTVGDEVVHRRADDRDVEVAE